MFGTLDPNFLASPQIAPADVARAKDLGVRAIINNRPDGEEPGAPQGADIEAAAREAGLGYAYIPVGHSGFSAAQLDALDHAMAEAGGPVLAYCRSGTRSTFLWALAQARAGNEPERIAAQAATAGYDVGPVRAMMDALAGQASS